MSHQFKTIKAILISFASDDPVEFDKTRRSAYEHDAHQPNQKLELKALGEKIEDLNFRKLRLMKDRALTWQDIQVGFSSSGVTQNKCSCRCSHLIIFMM